MGSSNWRWNTTKPQMTVVEGTRPWTYWFLPREHMRARSWES